MLIAAALLLRPLLAQRGLQRVSLAMGLLYLFIAPWLLSIFGNYGDLDSWHRARQIELFSTEPAVRWLPRRYLIGIEA